ncbi:MAG: capsule assembly Wzi family protein [Sphaerochaetaceae bacterium]|nr:capsule assembly Wzi family protein [Sphaerochaetaceae bacterium]
MKKMLLVSVLFALACAGTLFAAGPYSEMIPLSSPVYRDMDDLYAVMGIGTPSNARPWSKGEAWHILARVDADALRGVFRTLYDHLANEIRPGLRWQFSDGFGLGLGFESNIEMHAHSNGKDFGKDTDWVYRFEERRPFLKAWLDFGVKDFLYTYVDLRYGMGRTNPHDTVVHLESLPGWVGVGAIIPRNVGAGTTNYVTHSAVYSKGVSCNVPPTSAAFDFEWPKRAVFSLGGMFWNVSLARDRIDWGNSHIGNFIVDDHVDFHDYFRFVAFTDHFKYDWLNLFFDTNPVGGEAMISEVRMLMAHRLEFRPWDWLTFAISENVMYRAPSADFRFINPSFIFHNLNNRSMFNAIAHAELDIMLYQGLNLYGQFVLDQAKAPNESAAQADAWGILGGVEYAHVLGPGVLSSSLECAYTTPCLYRRDGVDFLMYRKYFTLGYSYILHFDYIGFPYGGDAQVLQWEVSYRMPGYGAVTLSLMGMRHGEMNMFKSHNMGDDNDGYPNYVGRTPSGDVIDESLTVSLSGTYGIPRFSNWVGMSVWSRLDWVGRRKYTRSSRTYGAGSSDCQFTLGLRIALQ